MKTRSGFSCGRFKVVIAAAVFLVFAGSPVWAQVGRPSKIFYVNLYHETADVRLDDGEKFVFEGVGLEPYSVTYYQETEDFGDYTLYYRLGSEVEWKEWRDEEGYLYKCPVKPGKLHTIIIGPDGSVDYFSLTADLLPGAKICFINGAESPMLSKMEVGAKFGDNKVAFIEDFYWMGVSNFVTAPPGYYGLFWQFPSQKVNDDDYFYYPNDDGTGYELLPFEKGKYYVFLVYTVSRDDYATLFDITPEYDGDY